MKLIWLFIFQWTILTGFAQSFRVMTYNIRLDVASDSADAWPHRKDRVVDLIQFHAPDIFGVQEALPHQMNYLDSCLTDFSFIGHGRDGGAHGEYSALFYNKNRMEVIENHTFWLSETPDTVSMGWDAACRRISTYGLFKDKESNQQFWVFNLHLDHMGKTARLKSIELLKQKIETINFEKLPVIVMGDFNATPESEPIKSLKKTLNPAYQISSLNYGPMGTFNGFSFCEKAEAQIDYIFVSANRFNVAKYVVLTDSKDLHYPSDHFPVLVELNINP